MFLILNTLKIIISIFSSNCTDSSRSINGELEHRHARIILCNHLYYPIIDSIINHPKIKFSEENQVLVLASEGFLSINYKESLPFVNIYDVTYLLIVIIFFFFSDLLNYFICYMIIILDSLF